MVRRKINEVPDIDLWRKFKAGDFGAFETMYKEQVLPLIQYGLKINPDLDVVKDAVHDLFVEIWNSRNKLSDTDNINFYLIKSLRYKLIRKNKPVISLSDLADSEIQAADATPELLLVSEEFQRVTVGHIRTALEKLPPRQQEAIYLYFFYGYSLSEMTRILSINYQSVANLLHRALMALKKELAGFHTMNLSAGLFLCAFFIFF